MALNAYLRLTGETQGRIEGSSTTRGREGAIVVIAAEHQVVSPRDAASGLPTGKRQHKPYVITKEVDKATPLLYNLLCNNENITDFKLEFWQPSRSGRESQYYTVELINARVADIRFEMLNNKNPEFMKYSPMEHIAFTYQKIIWTWEDGGITAEDDWETPVA